MRRDSQEVGQAPVPILFYGTTPSSHSLRNKYSDASFFSMQRTAAEAMRLLSTLPSAVGGFCANCFCRPESFASVQRLRK